MQKNLSRFTADLFKALAHPTRIAIVELLRNEGEIPVSQICERLRLEQANVSQHLAVLRSKQIVIWRKDANQVFYSLRHPMLIRVLDRMHRYFQKHLSAEIDLLDAMIEEESPPK